MLGFSMVSSCLICLMTLGPGCIQNNCGQKSKGRKEAPKVGKEKTQEDSVFSVKVDSDYQRALFVRKAKKDIEGKVPSDILKDFLNYTSTGNFKSARELCIFSHGIEFKNAPSVSAKQFSEFCQAMRDSVKEVTLSESVVKGKSEYWRVDYKFTSNESNLYEGSFDVILREGKWRLLERSYWSDIAKDYRDPDSKTRQLPRW